MTEHGVGSIVFAPPQAGTALILSAKDQAMAQAVNHLVTAVRELQILVAELQQAVAATRGAQAPHVPPPVDEFAPANVDDSA